MNNFNTQTKGGLIVSCQALSNEPLHSSYIMSRMAVAAKLGGAVGIRANSVEDIVEIKKAVDLPVIGIIKKDYPGAIVYITPTMAEVDALVQCGADVIAIDATDRIRPDGSTIKTLFPILRQKYPKQLFMADCSEYSDCEAAAALGFDYIGTTLCGYTENTKGTPLPNYELIKAILKLNVPIIAEGGIWTPEQLAQVMSLGVHCAVVGTAITRPMEITKRFVQTMGGKDDTCS